MTDKGLLERMEYAEVHHDRVRDTLDELRVLLSEQGNAAQLRDDLARKEVLIAQLEADDAKLRKLRDAANFFVYESAHQFEDIENLRQAMQEAENA